MKKLTLTAFVFSVLTTVAHAQDAPAADIAAGYSVIYVARGFTYFMNGGSVSAAWNVNHWLGAVGDFGAYRAPSGVSRLTAATYTLGPRFSYRQSDNFTPFAQVLLGGIHSSVATTAFTGVSNALAFGAGGGADLALHRRGRIALRTQLEYFGFRSNGGTVGNFRLSAGIVFRIGKKA